VRLSDAPIIILEGDEYLSSPVDRRPKFHLYRADTGLISGIAWDHINVFPTFEEYADQFKIFADNIPANGSLFYCDEDPLVREVALHSKTKALRTGYGIPSHEIINGITYLITPEGKIRLSVFGNHNLMNLEGARHICDSLGVTPADFYSAIGTFSGAARRLELLARNDSVAVYKDFAHSPSKLKATTHAVRSQFPGRRLTACMELHTFSSLNEEFLSQYAGTMDDADEAIVYFNPHTVEHKKLKPVSPEMVRKCFMNPSVTVFTDSKLLRDHLLAGNPENSVYLLMSSGNFDGLNLEGLAEQLTAGSREKASA
jgi:UDP-N-acetylmuramate: L-alanyl-gamma-D-glutamyl-meso-diaminopimelate ligase